MFENDKRLFNNVLINRYGKCMYEYWFHTTQYLNIQHYIRSQQFGLKYDYVLDINGDPANIGC